VPVPAWEVKALEQRKEGKKCTVASAAALDCPLMGEKAAGALNSVILISCCVTDEQGILSTYVYSSVCICNFVELETGQHTDEVSIFICRLQ
jgi:hypothetical protein